MPVVFHVREVESLPSVIEEIRFICVDYDFVDYFPLFFKKDFFETPLYLEYGRLRDDDVRLGK